MSVLKLINWFCSIQLSAPSGQGRLEVFGQLEGAGEGRQHPLTLELETRVSTRRFTCGPPGARREVELVGELDQDRAKLAGVPALYIASFKHGIPEHFAFLLAASPSLPPFSLNLSAAFPPVASTSSASNHTLSPSPLGIDKSLPDSLFNLGTGFRRPAGSPTTKRELNNEVKKAKQLSVKGKERAFEWEEGDEPLPASRNADRDEGYEEAALEGEEVEVPQEDVEMVESVEAEPQKALQGKDGLKEEEPGGSPPREESAVLDEPALPPSDETAVPPIPTIPDVEPLFDLPAPPQPAYRSLSTKATITNLVQGFFSLPHKLRQSPTLRLLPHPPSAERPTSSSPDLLLSRQEKALLSAVAQPVSPAAPAQKEEAKFELEADALVASTTSGVAMQAEEPDDDEVVSPEKTEEELVILLAEEGEQVETTAQPGADARPAATAIDVAVEKVAPGSERAQLADEPSVDPDVEVRDVDLDSVVGTEEDISANLPSPPASAHPHPHLASSDRASSHDPPHPRSTGSFASLYHSDDDEGCDTSADLTAQEISAFVERDLASSVVDEEEFGREREFPTPAFAQNEERQLMPVEAGMAAQASAGLQQLAAVAQDDLLEDLVEDELVAAQLGVAVKTGPPVHSRPSTDTGLQPTLSANAPKLPSPSPPLSPLITSTSTSAPDHPSLPSTAPSTNSIGALERVPSLPAPSLGTTSPPASVEPNPSALVLADSPPLPADPTAPLPPAPSSAPPEAQYTSQRSPSPRLRQFPPPASPVPNRLASPPLAPLPPNGHASPEPKVLPVSSSLQETSASTDLPIPAYQPLSSPRSVSPALREPEPSRSVVLHSQISPEQVPLISLPKNPARSASAADDSALDHLPSPILEADTRSPVVEAESFPLLLPTSAEAHPSAAPSARFPSPQPPAASAPPEPEAPEDAPTATTSSVAFIADGKFDQQIEVAPVDTGGATAEGDENGAANLREEEPMAPSPPHLPTLDSYPQSFAEIDQPVMVIGRESPEQDQQGTPVANDQPAEGSQGDELNVVEAEEAAAPLLDEDTVVDVVKDVAAEATGEIVSQVVGNLVEQVAGEAVAEAVGEVTGQAIADVTSGAVNGAVDAILNGIICMGKNFFPEDEPYMPEGEKDPTPDPSDGEAEHERERAAQEAERIAAEQEEIWRKEAEQRQQQQQALAKKVFGSMKEKRTRGASESSGTKKEKAPAPSRRRSSKLDPLSFLAPAPLRASTLEHSTDFTAQAAFSALRNDPAPIPSFYAKPAGAPSSHDGVGSTVAVSKPSPRQTLRRKTSPPVDFDAPPIAIGPALRCRTASPARSLRTGRSRSAKAPSAKSASQAAGPKQNTPQKRPSPRRPRSEFIGVEIPVTVRKKASPKRRKAIEPIVDVSAEPSKGENDPNEVLEDIAKAGPVDPATSLSPSLKGVHSSPAIDESLPTPPHPSNLLLLDADPATVFPRTSAKSARGQKLTASPPAERPPHLSPEPDPPAPLAVEPEPAWLDLPPKPSRARKYGSRTSASPVKQVEPRSRITSSDSEDPLAGPSPSQETVQLPRLSEEVEEQEPPPPKRRRRSVSKSERATKEASIENGQGDLKHDGEKGEKQARGETGLPQYEEETEGRADSAAPVGHDDEDEDEDDEPLPALRRKRPAPTLPQADDSADEDERSPKKPRADLKPLRAPSLAGKKPRPSTESPANAPHPTGSSRKARPPLLPTNTSAPPATPATATFSSRRHRSVDTDDGETPASATRPRRNRKSTQGWWELGRGLEAAEVTMSIKKRAREEGEEEIADERDLAEQEEEPQASPRQKGKKPAPPRRRASSEPLAAPPVGEGEDDNQDEPQLNGVDTSFEPDTSFEQEDENGEDGDQEQPHEEDKPNRSPTKTSQSASTKPGKKRRKRKSVAMPRFKNRTRNRSPAKKTVVAAGSPAPSASASETPAPEQLAQKKPLARASDVKQARKEAAAKEKKREAKEKREHAQQKRGPMLVTDGDKGDDEDLPGWAKGDDWRMLREVRIPKEAAEDAHRFSD
ncbi:hypothetical protein JCM11641_004450 [Rhodosporidiobolus odoratus]